METRVNQKDKVVMGKKEEKGKMLEGYIYNGAQLSKPLCL